ncbi:SusC/RagA family TonB-linked outer membrane protein [Bacteroides eggerthii]|uniref:SusC/RagA family TonB-linked outer membrane protein n=1 Tax=Bacteroides eggerthii TaxID=28111 RepID=UPI0035634C1C
MIKKRSLLAFWLCMLGIAQTMFAQNIQVSGTITDGDLKETLIGVNVLLDGSSTGVISDIDGNYTINAPADGVLVFSFVGLDTKRVPINGRTRIDIVMSSNMQELEEVVVVGYGVMKKKDLTGSVGSVKAEELSKVVSSNVGEALAGRVAGLHASTTSGDPGSTPVIRIRGGNSISGSNDPLWVIDGFISAGGASTISSEDIESIEVLKDASATAIYGARGANGVILVSTKKGKAGKVNIDFKATVGAQWLNKKPSLMNSEQTIEYWNAFDPNYLDQNINAQTNTDWIDELTRTSMQEEYYMAVNGGNEKITFKVSADYLKQNGIIKYNSDYQRANFATRVDFDINKYINAGVNVRYRYTKRNALGNGNIFQLAQSMSPLVKPYNEDGSYNLALNPCNLNDKNGVDLYKDNGNGVKGNPIQYLRERENPMYTKMLNLQGFINAKILKDFILRSEISLTTINDWIDMYSPSTLDIKTPSQISVEEGITYEWVNTLNWKKDFNRIHSFNAVIGSTIQGETTRGASAYSRYMPIDGFKWNSLGSGNPIELSDIKVKSNYVKSTMASFLARINYVFKDKYLFTFSGRADGASKFSDNNKWGVFPSGAFSWRMSEEKFIKDLNIFSSLKLRTSYGLTGSEAIKPYQTLGLMESNSAFIGSSSNAPFGTTTTIYRPVLLENPDLTWETTAQWDAGLDFGFFDNKLTVSIDYYQKETRDLLLEVPVALESGYDTKLTNIGKVSNKGFEFTISTTPILTKNFCWTSEFNYGMNKNKVVSLGGVQRIDQAPGSDMPETIYLEVGKPVGIIYGYVTNGIWQNAEEIANNPHRSSDKPGDFRIIDTNKDGKIESNDKVAIANPNPKFTFGFNNTFSYKNIDLTVFFSGAYGHDVLNFNKHKLMVDNMRHADLVHYWTPENHSNTHTSAGNSNVAKMIDKYVEDGSFVRLKNLSIRYHLPKSLTNKIGINKLSVFLTGTDLLTITKYSGFNPEANQSGGSNTILGIDYNTYPTRASISGGVTLNF